MSGTNSAHLAIRLPTWAVEFLAQKKDTQQVYPTANARMELAILLSKLNIQHHTGGPFGAAVFNMDNHQLISIGINLVMTNHCSSQHAEMVALTLAQQSLHAFSLHADHLPRCELVSSCEPCAMCFGAIPWSGVRKLTSGATASDAEAIGFDEGPKHPNWIGELESRGITVTTALLQQPATDILQAYQQNHGIIYNGNKPSHGT